MDIGKSFAWILFLGVVASASALGRHHHDEAPRPSGPAVQMAAPLPAPADDHPLTSTVAMDSTRGLALRTASHALK